MWYGTLGCWASARSEVLFDFIDECARRALMSHDPRAWWDIRAMRKCEQRSVKTSGEFGGTTDLWYGTRLGCWASARSDVLFYFIDECARSTCPDEPRPTGLVGYPRHKERRATICQDEWRAWRHRGLVVWLGRWDAGRLREARYCLICFIEECARCALMSHDPRAWWAIRAIRKGEQRSVKTSEELGWRHRGVEVWDAGMLGVG